ncbi:MAG: hypothetical protein JO290_12480 [Sphingomonadaceae bacterium]|nr:hypothetical protein [Sphingomonadaceae bacterium]
MMFVMLTRAGGKVVVRLRPEAIAFIEEMPVGCGVHLIGGELLRVNEDIDTVEGLCSTVTVAAPLPAQPVRRAKRAKASA